MKLDSPTRVNLFSLARRADERLGDLFQNPHNLTPEMIQKEFDEARRYRDEIWEKYSLYLAHLRTLKWEVEHAPDLPQMDQQVGSESQP